MHAGASIHSHRSGARHRLIDGRAQAVYPSFSLSTPTPTGSAPPLSNAARYVGRVGALAVALGVGVALATGYGAGAARADDGSDSGASSDSSASESSSSQPSSQSPASGPPMTATTPSASESTTSSADPSDSTTAGGATTSTGPRVPEMNVRSSGGAHTSGSRSTASDPEPDDNDDDATPVRLKESPSSGQQAATPPRAEESPAAPDPELVPVGALTTLSAQLDSTAETSPEPETPAPSPVLWTVLAWTRREADQVEGAVASASPLAAPDEQFVVEEDGVLEGVVAPPLLGLLPTVLAGPRNGTLVLGPTGSFVYTPDANFHGQDDFTLAFGLLGLAQTIGITVTPVNDAPVSFDGGITVTRNETYAGRLNGAYDVDRDPITYAVGSQPANGSVVVNTDGTFTYTPTTGYHGIDQFSYTVSDGQATSTYTVSVTPYNSAPVANLQNVVVDENRSHSGTLSAATDADDDPITYAVQTPPENGKVTISPDGGYTYTPDAGYFGRDAFVFSVTDPLGGRADYTVFVTVRMVNNAPVASDTAITVTENGSYTGALPTATDADGEAVSYSLSRGPDKGTVTIGTDGTFTYTPDSGLSGSDRFSYDVTDGVDTSTYTVSVTIQSINHAPVAVDAIVTTPHGVPVTFGNIFGDPDGDPLTFTLDQPSDGGSFTVDPNGTVTFTPRAGFAGEAAVAYTVTDPFGLAASATITVVVTNGPVVAGEDVFIGDDTVYSGNLLANDIDSDRDPITIVDHTWPPRGTLVLSPDGNFTYTPEPGVSGTFAFTYTVSDGVDFQIVPVRFIVAAAGKPPLSAPDVATVEAGETVVIDVLANDTDPNDVGGLWVVSVDEPASGTVYITESGVEYTADPDVTGVITFTYTVSNGWDERTETVTVTVRPSTAPVTVDDEITVRAGENVVIDALGNDRIPEGAVITVTSPPYNGTVRFDELTGTFVYTPGEESWGDGFEYTVTDALGRTSSSRVAITVDEAPYADDDSASTPIGESVVIDVLENDYDAEEGWLTVRIVAQPERGGKAVAQKDGTVVFTPDKDFQGYVTFEYSITDAAGNTATATVGVNVYDPTPVDLDKKYTVGKDKTITVTAALGLLSGTVYAEYGKARLYEKPRNGTVRINLDGSFTYTPNEGFVGEDSFVFSLDGGEFGDGATAFITVTPDGPGTEAGYGDAVALTFDSAMGACWDSWMPWQRGPGSQYLGCLYPEARPEEL